MKKITLFLITMLPSLLFAQGYTTPGTGMSYTLDEIIELNPATITMDGADYILNENLTVAATDTLLLDTAVNLFIEAGVEVDVHGTFISNPDEEIVNIDAVDETTPYQGFWFYEESKVFINNTHIQNGGGLKAITPDFTLLNSYLANNVEGSSSGAVVSLSNGSPLIEGNTFINNDLPAISSGATSEVSARILSNYLEGNGQSNENRPQINLGVTGTDTLKIIGNTIIGDPDLTQVGGIAVANFLGSAGEVKAIIDNNIITGNRYGITILGDYASGYIRENVIEDNNIQGDPMLGGSGINLNATNDTQNIIASNNQISGNLWGITLQGEASINLGDDADNPGGNVFSNNTNGGEIYALYNNTDNTIMAKHNCWTGEADMTLEDAEAVIVHSNDDSIYGEVIFDPINCDALNIENPILADFEIYPNPANNYFEFFNAPNFNKLQVYNLTGRLIVEKELQQEGNRIDLSLPNGIYMLQFSNQNLRTTKKLIVE